MTNSSSAANAFYSRVTPSLADRLGRRPEYIANAVLIDVFTTAEADLKRRGVPDALIRQHLDPQLDKLTEYVRRLESPRAFLTRLLDDAPTLTPTLPETVADFARDVAQAHAAALRSDAQADAADH